MAVYSIHGSFRWICNQDTFGTFPYMASRCTRGSTDADKRDSCRRPAENGNLRLDENKLAHVSRCGQTLPVVYRLGRCGQYCLWSLVCLRTAQGRETGFQETDCLLISQPYGFCGTWHGGTKYDRYGRSNSPDVQPRHNHKHALHGSGSSV